MPMKPGPEREQQVLVTASSKHGATAEIADAIARRLREHGVASIRQAPEDVDTVEQFDGVILGSAVYAGRWQPDASKFAARFAAQLRERDVWLFSSGPVGDPPGPVDDPVGIEQLMTDLAANGHQVLPGRIDLRALGRGERLVVRALKVPDGDARDWDAVSGWADEIAAALRSSADPTPATP